MISPSRPWTRDLQRRAQRLRAGGLTYSAIGRRIGVSGDCVRYHLKPGEAERRNRNSRNRYARLVAALGPRPPRKLPQPARALSIRLRGIHLARLEQTAAAGGLGVHAIARQLLEQALEGEPRPTREN